MCSKARTTRNQLPQSLMGLCRQILEGRWLSKVAFIVGGGS
jgi:hypothetical protein